VLLRLVCHEKRTKINKIAFASTVVTTKSYQSAAFKSKLNKDIMLVRITVEKKKNEDLVARFCILVYETSKN